MSEVTIEQANIEAAYKVADENGKKMLDALFGARKPKPTLDDYKTIKTYEDACEALGESIDEEALLVAGVPKHIIALMKLEIISRALWGRDFEPTPDAEGKKVYYYPWFALYTEGEIKRMTASEKGALLSAGARGGAAAGFGYLGTGGRSSNAAAYFGFRLCQETVEKVKYFGRQFIELWAEYLAYNFTVGGKLNNY